MQRKHIYLFFILIMFAFIMASCSISERKMPETEKTKFPAETNEEPFTKMQNYSPEYNITISGRTIKDNVYLEGFNLGGKKDSDAARRILNMASKIDKAPINATIDNYTWEILDKGQYGKRVNVYKTLEALLNSDEGGRVRLVVEPVPPDVTYDELRSKIVLLGSYSTVLLDRSPSRFRNIQIASRKINYEKVMPGEEFSFNKALGKRTRKKGYQRAPVILKTNEGHKKIYDYGGGICQLSSTVYNAVRECGLEITERHSHSKQVHYVPKGMDAAVSYGYLDFRFINNRKHAVMLTVNLTKSRVTVSIYENRS